MRILGGLFLILAAQACDVATTPASTVPTVVDQELLEWPAAYQEFVAGVGGSNFVDVDGTSVHYVQTGPDDADEAVLLVHGIPTHSYLWRNVIPELSGRRVIAVDLVGYGRSERPANFAYTPSAQADMLGSFVDALGLQTVHLVAHDLGGPAGLTWAAQHEDQVGSVSMFETLWSTVPDGVDAIAPPFGGTGGLLDQMRDPEIGPTLVGEQNLFLAALSDFTVTGVSETDQAVYHHPWPNAADRASVFLPSGPLAFPFPQSQESTAVIRTYQDWLESSAVEKLVIDISPGALSAISVPVDGVDGERVSQLDYASAQFPNVTRVGLSPAGHFAQEDLPTELGEAIHTFLEGL